MGWFSKNTDTADNTFRNGEKKQPSKKKKGAKKKVKNAPGFLSRLNAFIETFSLKNKRSRRMWGALLVLFSGFLLLSCLSFLFTWKVDHSWLENGVDSWSTAEIKGLAKNWMGIIGARLAFFLMYKGIGIAAFSVIPLLLVAGINLLSEKKLFKYRKIFGYSFFMATFLPLLLALFFHNAYPTLSGYTGFALFSWLREIIGVIGVFLLLGLYLYAFAVLLLGWDKAIFRKKEMSSAEEIPMDEDDNYRADTLFDMDNINVAEQQTETETSDQDKVTVEDETDFSVTHAMDEKEEDIPATESENANDDFVIETTNEENTEEIAEEDLALEVAEAKEEEEGKKIERQGIETNYDPRLDLSSYQFPILDFLEDHGGQKTEVSQDELHKSKDLIVQTLKNYKIDISSIKATIGPTVTLFEIVPAPGVKISKIKNLEDDIALSLAALGIRIIAPIPGRGTIGIEVPNEKPEIVSMKSVLKSKKYQESKFDLPVCLGKTISNEVYVADLAKMPHLLMAGATGQGKSVGLNALLVSLMYKKHPAELKFVLVDPKKVELTLFRAIERHFLAKLPGEGEAVITENQTVIHTLNSLCVEMDNRYKLLQDAMVRNIKEYNRKFINRKLNPNEGHRYLPYIVVVIDEVADLIMTAGKEIEHPVGRLAQLARAIGIHLVLATQRPSVNIITGTIKANFPARIAFRVTSKIDSRTILDTGGAEQLIGKGDMLYADGSQVVRLQCPFVDTPEVESITEFIGNQRGYPDAHLLPEIKTDEGGGVTEEFDADSRDALFEDAARMVVLTQQGSTSMLQRKLKIGYNRAGRLIDQLEHANIVGPFEGSKAREVLVADEMALEQYLSDLS